MDEMEEDTDDEKNQILMSMVNPENAILRLLILFLCWPCVFLYSVTFHLAKVWVVLQSL